MPFASYHKQQSRVYPSISNRAEWRRHEKAHASRVGVQEGGVEDGADGEQANEHLDIQEGRLNRWKWKGWEPLNGTAPLFPLLSL
jgi:hypothetical protein